MIISELNFGLESCCHNLKKIKHLIDSLIPTTVFKFIILFLSNRFVQLV